MIGRAEWPDEKFQGGVRVESQMKAIGAIARQVDIRQLEQDYRADCKPIIDEMVWVHSISLRPIFFRDGIAAYGSFPPEAQAYLDLLQRMIDETAGRYRALAATSSFSSR